MALQANEWDIAHLRDHLQAAVQLEAWTIPYYMAPMFSIVDRSSNAYQLLQSVVNQEMLHLQLAANLSNAYGLSPDVPVDGFVYEGTTIPHLEFDLDPNNPIASFSPYSAEIGPLDEQRINGMCLVEYPEWKTGGTANLNENVSEYGSIGEFYDAVEYGAELLASNIVGGVNQVDFFAAFYRDLPQATISGSGSQAYAEVALLIDTIRDQGEGRKTAGDIAPPFQNTADDSEPNKSHFDKFTAIKDQGLPETYALKDVADYTAGDQRLQQILANNFATFCTALTDLFAGKNPAGFGPLMVTIGGNILACWKAGVTPKFT